jgi:hypothetical protein
VKSGVIGTSAVGAAQGRLDGLAFMGGLIVGIVIFAEAYGALSGFVVSGDQGTETLPGWLGLSPWIIWLGLTVMALGAFRLARRLEGRR